jgi:nucleotide-binding universal stress UspA family protein
MLVPFDVPVHPEAAGFAVDSAVETGRPLIVVNVVEMPFRPMTLAWGMEIVVTEDVDDSLRAPAELARSLAVEVERLRIVSPRPVTALLELVGERSPGLLVVGPDRSRMRRLMYRRVVGTISERAPCLVWIPPG